MGLYKKGVGVLQTFPPVKSEREAKDFIKKYCEEHNVKVMCRERFYTEHWNYLSDGTEIDYCIE